MQRVLDRHAAETRFRDQQPPMNNLAPGGRALGGFLPKRDQSAGTTQGSPGSTTGGTPKRAEREPTRPALRSGAFTVDQPDNRPRRPPSSMFAPSPEGLGDIISKHTLPPPGEGMVYQLEPQADGSIAVVCIPDDGADMNQNDAAYRHRLGDAANIKFMKRLNGIHRRRWARTKDYASEVRRVIFHHTPLPSERMELVEKDDGSVDLVIWSPSTDLVGPKPPGIQRFGEDNTSPDWPTQNWAAAPGSRPGERSIHQLQEPIRTGDRMSEAVRLKAMNAANARFWAR